MTARSHSFTHAIVRWPSETVVRGLRTQNRGVPDYRLMKHHYRDYIIALEDVGIAVTQLDPLPEFPDSVFVEDTALCLPEGAVMMRPGAPSRVGEVAAIRPVVEGFYGDVREITEPGTIEGGDILVTEREILVGTSSRTNQEGFEQLRAIVEPWGYSARLVETPAGVLHFKSDCALLDGETILATRRLAASGCFEGYRVILVADGEEIAANAIRINQYVYVSTGFDRTEEKVRRSGFDVGCISTSELAKLDGGLSCLSLRFTPPARNR